MVTPINGCVQTVLPLVYKECLSLEELLYKVVFKVNEIITTNNELRKEWEEFQEEFETNLYDTVNQIITQMYEDGLFDDLIFRFVNEIYKTEIYCPKDNQGGMQYNTSTNYTIILPSHKCIVFDCGYEDTYNKVSAYLRNKKIQKIDYLIVSHFDEDHANYIPQLIQEWCDKNTMIFRCMDWDFDVAPAGNMTKIKQNISLFNSACLSIGVTPVIPVDNYTYNFPYYKFRFLNTKVQYLQDYYTKSLAENGPGSTGRNYNEISLITELTIGNYRILFTGDCGTWSQQNNAPNIESVDLMELPHHASNYCGYFDFFLRSNTTNFFTTGNFEFDTTWMYRFHSRFSGLFGKNSVHYPGTSDLFINISNNLVSFNGGTIFPNGKYGNSIAQTSKVIYSLLPYATDYSNLPLQTPDWTWDQVEKMLDASLDSVICFNLSPTSLPKQLWDEIEPFLFFNDQPQMIKLENSGVGWVVDCCRINAPMSPHFVFRLEGGGFKTYSQQAKITTLKEPFSMAGYVINSDKQLPCPPYVLPRFFLTLRETDNTSVRIPCIPIMENNFSTEPALIKGSVSWLSSTDNTVYIASVSGTISYQNVLNINNLNVTTMVKNNQGVYVFANVTSTFTFSQLDPFTY